MRTAALAAALLALPSTSGCDGSRPPEIDRIEIKVTGWSAVEIALDRGGKGSFRLSEPFPRGNSGALSVTPDRFQTLRRRLEPYRRQSVPVTEESARRFIEAKCPEGVPSVTDAGGIYIRWIDETSDRHFAADFGCDPERQASRNEQLLGIVNSLPLPTP
ncbi:MAG TPA: hypothetical protein VFP12_03385 [Allosphingosinicella sp.]|nr:hypothetical protein [Allosphingosinicella sp.]